MYNINRILAELTTLRQRQREVQGKRQTNTLYRQLTREKGLAISLVFANSLSAYCLNSYVRIQLQQRVKYESAAWLLSAMRQIYLLYTKNSLLNRPSYLCFVKFTPLIGHTGRMDSGHFGKGERLLDRIHSRKIVYSKTCSCRLCTL